MDPLKATLHHTKLSFLFLISSPNVWGPVQGDTHPCPGTSGAWAAHWLNSDSSPQVGERSPGLLGRRRAGLAGRGQGQRSPAGEPPRAGTALGSWGSGSQSPGPPAASCPPLPLDSTSHKGGGCRRGSRPIPGPSGPGLYLATTCASLAPVVPGSRGDRGLGDAGPSRLAVCCRALAWPCEA